MKIRIVTKQKVEAWPLSVWNAYVNLLAMEPHDELTEEQRPAHLVFWYESEVQNGGHLQYFENRGTEHLQETVDALELLGANCQKKILEEAGELFLGRERSPIASVEDFVAAEQEGEFTAFDRRFYACSPPLPDRLKAHLALHQSWFVTIV
ncbi:MAG: DUF4375 domain-containing protein [Candidatus Sulfotelmatobacter sp.]